MPDMEVCDLFDLTKTLAAPLFEGVRYPWEVLKEIKAFLRALGARLSPDEYEQRGEDIWVARDALVFPSAYIEGPTIIGRGAQIRHSAFIRGSALVGAGAVVGNSTELKNVILFDGVQVPHFNYVGDSVLGYKAHMGAGAITSNVRSDKRNIVVHTPDGDIEIGLRKFGAMLGDHVEVGCNSVLNPGTVVGAHSIVYPTSSVRGVVPARSIHKHSGAIIPRIMEDRG